MTTETTETTEDDVRPEGPSLHESAGSTAPCADAPTATGGRRDEDGEFGDDADSDPFLL